MKQRKNQHNWTYLPELGQEWAYCELCDKARTIYDPKTLYPYKQAVKLVQKPAGTVQECQTCGGRGFIVVDAICEDCGGFGWVTQEQLKKQVEKLREY